MTSLFDLSWPRSLAIITVDVQADSDVSATRASKSSLEQGEGHQEILTPDGWPKTGDIAHVYDEGKFCIADHKNDLIKVKCNQAAPAELEVILLEHLAVAYC